MLDSSLPSIITNRMLALLYFNEPCSLKALCELYGITTSTGSLMVDKLVQMRYVNRRQDETDRRRIVISLTDEGIKESENTFKIQIDCLSNAISQLNEDDQDKLKKSILEAKKILEKINPKKITQEKYTK
jgi:DNA-binding MarR family transcriptional regulator